MLPESSFLSPRRFVPEMMPEPLAFSPLVGEKLSDSLLVGEKLSEIMWNAALPIAEEALQTCHIQGMKYGDIDPNVYGSFRLFLRVCRWEIAEEIAVTHPDLAQSLFTLVDNFDYMQLLAAIDLTHQN